MTVYFTINISVLNINSSNDVTREKTITYLPTTSNDLVSFSVVNK